MAVSDPNPDVPTPTGTLAGLAAFAWDGSAWQPTGRAQPSVATPTGVLRGVAPFSWDGSNWQPVGAAKPSVATPSGTLDGVALYTWNGSAWTPSGGVPDVPTPSGTLQGIAGFYFDGTNWQPSGRAAPEIAVPGGVLMGAAMFAWNGAAWTAAPSLDLNFLTGTLDSRITFTRASTATYFNATGTLQTAANNVARFDHDPTTRATNGLLIEEARTNIALQSGDPSNAAWTTGSGNGPVVPTVTGNNQLAPDGTTSAATVVFPAISGANANSFIRNNCGGAIFTAATYTNSVWLKGSVGGEQINLILTNFTTYYHTRVTLTTSWQRFSVSGTATAANWNLAVGTDLRDGTQSSTLAQTIYMWGGQVELGAFATSYIPTTSGSATRAADVATMPVPSGFNSNAGSWAAELTYLGAAAANSRVIAQNNAHTTPLFIGSGLVAGSYDQAAAVSTANALTIGAVAKMASAWAANVGAVCLNAGTAVSGAQTTGFSSLSTIQFMGATAAGDPTTDGWLRRVRYWPRALSSAELQQATT